MTEARRLGGLRRRRERTVQAIYDFGGLTSIDQLRRVAEIAMLDTLGMETSVARSRTLAYLIQTAAKLIEMEEGKMERSRIMQETLPPPPPRTKERRH
jgi:hypothetical protein